MMGAIGFLMLLIGAAGMDGNTLVAGAMALVGVALVYFSQGQRR